MALTGKVEKLREEVLGAPEVCLERGIYMTESYIRTEG